MAVIVDELRKGFDGFGSRIDCDTETRERIDREIDQAITAVEAVADQI
jgi:hypothetical protein